MLENMPAGINPETKKELPLQNHAINTEQSPALPVEVGISSQPSESQNAQNMPPVFVANSQPQPQIIAPPPLVHRICHFLVAKQHVFAYTVLFAALAIVFSLFGLIASNAYFIYRIAIVFFAIIFLSLLLTLNAAALLAISAIYTRRPKQAWLFWLALVPMAVATLILGALCLSVLYEIAQYGFYKNFRAFQPLL